MSVFLGTKNLHDETLKEYTLHSTKNCILLLQWRYVTDTAGIQTVTCSHTAIRSCGLRFNGLHLRNPYNYMDYCSLTHVHLSTIDQAKVSESPPGNDQRPKHRLTHVLVE